MKDVNKSRTLDFDLELGSHDFVRPEMVLALPSFGRSVPAGEGVVFFGSLSKERSSPESKEGISKEREERALESEFARA